MFSGCLTCMYRDLDKGGIHLSTTQPLKDGGGLHRPPYVEDWPVPFSATLMFLVNFALYLSPFLPFHAHLNTSRQSLVSGRRKNSLAALFLHNSSTVSSNSKLLAIWRRSRGRNGARRPLARVWCGKEWVVNYY